MSIIPGQKLTGPEKAAVLLLSLSEEYAGKIMGQLEDYEIRDVSLVMATLGSIPSDVVEKVYVEFAEGMSMGSQLVGTYSSTERALLKVMPPEKVKVIMEEIRGPAGKTIWDKMDNISEEALADYLKNEYPQTIAVVLSKIKTSHVAKVISLLPEELAIDVMLRLLKMGAVQREILNDIEHTLKTDLMSDVAQTTSKDPYEMLADIFDAFDRRTEEKYMAMLEERNTEAAERIKSLMFTFDDLLKLDSMGIQTVIKTVDKVQLSLALKGTKQEIKDLLFDNMSERTAKILKEDMESLGMVKLKNVDAAQLDIINTMKELANRGEIIIPEEDEEEVMIE